MQYDRTVIAYHGCMASVAEGLLTGSAFKPSENENDWLGHGIYFWEYGPERALQWAQERYARLSKPSDGPGDPPAVVGSIIQLGKCFDLLDTRFTDELAAWAELFVRSVRSKGLVLPHNAGTDLGSRRFDCAVINFALATLEAELGIRYDTVRCAFVEGPAAYEDAEVKTEIRRQTHIQIAVRNPQCIVGTFRPALPH